MRSCKNTVTDTHNICKGSFLTICPQCFTVLHPPAKLSREHGIKITMMGTLSDRYAVQGLTRVKPVLLIKDRHFRRPRSKNEQIKTTVTKRRSGQEVGRLSGPRAA